MTAPNLSPTEAATVARFDAAPDAEESLRERVAKALYGVDITILGGDVDWQRLQRVMPHMVATYRSYADAAIAVLRGES